MVVLKKFLNLNENTKKPHENSSLFDISGIGQHRFREDPCYPCKWLFLFFYTLHKIPRYHKQIKTNNLNEIHFFQADDEENNNTTYPKCEGSNCFELMSK